MYEAFTERSRKVMGHANAEAQRFNHEYIGTEHVLLGLIREGCGVAANVLKNLGLNLSDLRKEVEKAVHPGPDMITMGRLPLTPRAKKAIEYSREEAREFGCHYVGTEALLLGLVREEESVAAAVLGNSGVTLESVRKTVLELIPKPVDHPEKEQAVVKTIRSSSDDVISHRMFFVARAMDLSLQMLKQQKKPATPESIAELSVQIGEAVYAHFRFTQK
ncbi:MAG TPA: Clp protease N-terminal domain-containing protein [Planctomicrobium sp.]|nr:Clp protease N-terminal domain-containing protein [Planctomicrobium sp.]